jgi:hypothetical protein
MKRERGDVLIVLLSLAAIVVLINMAQLLPKGAAYRQRNIIDQMIEDIGGLFE